MTEEAADPLRRRLYKNPPVVEAIARLQWPEPIQWNFTTPGLMYELLKDLYPEEPSAQAVMEAGVFGPDPQGLNGPPGQQPPGPNVGGGFQVRTRPQRILFSRDAKSRLLGVSPIDVSVHGIQPYEGWENLEERLYVALARIVERFEVDDPRFNVVGLRYINRIEIPAETIQFLDYLTISIGFPDGFPSTISGFLDRTEMQYPNENVSLALTWASTEPMSGNTAFILDLDLTAMLEPPADMAHAKTTLADLKKKEGRAFEALLQDRLREQFDEIR